MIPVEEVPFKSQSKSKALRGIFHVRSQINAAINKIANEPLTASASTRLTVDQRASYPTAGQEKCSVQAQNCEDGRGHEKEDQSSLVGTVVDSMGGEPTDASRLSCEVR